MDFPGRLIAGIMAAILIIIFPLQYIAHSHNEDIDILVDDRTHQFTDNIRQKGYLDIDMYEEYVNYLDSTGERYEIEIQDIHPVTGEEEAHTHKMGTFMNVSYKKNMSFATHSHSDDCYAGHRHNSECGKIPLTFIISRSGSTLSDWWEALFLNCGYCHKTILEIQTGVSTWTPEQIQIISGNIYKVIYSKEDYVNYWKAVDEFNTLKANLQPYINKWTGDGQDTIAYGYVKPEKFTFELPLLGNINTCELPNSPACDGIPRVFTIRGGYNHYEGRWMYDFKCNYCHNTIMKANYSFYNSNHYYYIGIYKPGYSIPHITYNDSKLLAPFFNRLFPNGYGIEINTSITIDDPVLQFDFLKEVKNHGCTYPKAFCNREEDNNPICNKVVTSISATPTTQTVTKGQPINLTVKATYLDGHTEEIKNYKTNYDSSKIGTQTVTITYTGLVGNAKTTGTRTCTVTVTVKSDKKLTSISVTPTSQTIKKYSSPTFTVRAYYDDGTSKVLSSSDYKVSGLNVAKIGTQNITLTYTEEGITKSTTATITVTPLMRECPRCHNEYELNHDDSDPGCPFCKEIIIGIDVSPDYIEVTKGESLPITVVAIYNDGSREVITGWTSNYNPERAGLQIVTVEYGGHGKEITVWVNERLIICPVCNTEYPESESECPVCAEKVVSIIADPAEITVMQYEPIVLTVTAIFANGDSRDVDEWSIDKNTTSPGTFTATVSYKGVSTTIKLTVLSLFSIQCPICGTIYDISENPKGCPVCSEKLIGIEAYLPSGSNLVQLGTTPTIVVILVFRDEHREFAYDGFTLEGFNPNQLGEQTATVRYKEFYTTLVLEVVNMADTITCPNGHVYYRNADGTDPGCPFCNTSEEISKVIYFEITYTTDILNEVYSNGVYHFDKGNYISVIVIKKNKSLLYRLQKTFFGTSLLGRKKRFIYGGNIQKT